MRTFPSRSFGIPGRVEGLSIFHPTLLLRYLFSLAVVAALAVGAIDLALALSPPGMSANLADGATDVPLDSVVHVRSEGWGARLERAVLAETSFDLDGNPAGTREVPLQLSSVRESWLPGQTEVLIRPSDQTLRTDARYRLTLRSTAVVAALPLPRSTPVEREVDFRTPASPRPRPAPAVTQLRWQEPLAIRWTTFVDDFRYEVTPMTASRGWVDANDRSLTYVLLENPQEATTYQIAVVDAVGRNSMRLQAPSSFEVTTPARPRPAASEDPVTAIVGEPLMLRWNVPMERIAFDVKPAVPSSWRVNPHDPTLTEIMLQGLEQDEAYELSITEAVARSGAPLAEPKAIKLETPPPLKVAGFQTGTERPLVPVDAWPIITFAEPIRDRQAAEQAITVNPPTPGYFEWLDDTRAQYVTKDGFPFATEVTFQIRPGPDGARSKAGGYLEEEAAFTFKTIPDKIIEVNLSKQQLSMIEKGQVIKTIWVATGVPGGETPTGEYYVQYKMASTRFRGVNPSGSTYDIPDVHWVMPFLGDYTLHGAYWRQAFGRVGSAGCVSMTDADAKVLYDWTPVGTSVQIHY